MKTEIVYKNQLITKNIHTGYFYCLTKNGRVISDTLKGIKEMININL